MKGGVSLKSEQFLRYFDNIDNLNAYAPSDHKRYRNNRIMLE